MHKILTVVGARPQFVKASAISHAIAQYGASYLCEDLLHTGQHYDADMSAHFFTELDIPQPRYNLGVGSATHARQTSAVMQGVEEVLLAGSYDAVLVYGDTNSTLGAALAAAKLCVPVFHIEAGLRSHNMLMPEEVNRRLTDHCSTLLFAPTPTAAENLRNEGFDDQSVHQVGDVMYDNVLHYLPIARARHAVQHTQPTVFATVHRNYNVDDAERLKTILAALCTLGERFEARVLLPLHPRTRQKLESMCVAQQFTGIDFVAPMSYLQTLAAIDATQLVLTDSGGLQKEACFCGKPCVVLRDETEWTELTNSGAARLAGANADAIVQAACALYGTTTPVPPCFGDGHAAQHIISAIIDHFRNGL